MSHEVETMAYAGEVPWHGLGVEVSNDLSPSEMMEKAGLNWTVEKVDSYIKHDGQEIKTGTQSLVRSSDSSILTNVGPDWVPVQNKQAFEFFSEYVNTGNMEMHTAGSLKDGKMVWALAKINDGFELFSGDAVESYLLFSNPHQYGKSIDIRFTPIRVVCNNTLSLSLNSASNNSVKVDHRKEFSADNVKEALGIASLKLEKYKDMASFLGSKRYTKDNLIQYYNTVFPKRSTDGDIIKIEDLSRNAQACMEAIDKQPGSKFAEGTWWQAFNSVTYITDHVQGRNADNRLYTSWFGDNINRKNKALETTVQYAEAA